MRRLALVTCAISFALPVPGAIAQLATFDSLSEGPIGPMFVDGGITFFDADNRLAPDPPDNFMIEDASASAYGALFSSPNVLSMTGYEAGPQAGYSRFGSMKATLGGQTRTFAACDVFYANDDFGNSIVFELFASGNLVASETVLIGTSGFASHHFQISGVEFDTIRLIGLGPVNQGVLFGAVDNVRIDIPSPGAPCVFAGLALARRRRR